MQITRITREKFIVYSKDWIVNASNDPYISQKILTIGYDENRLNEGLAQQQTTHDSRQQLITAKNKAKSLGTELRKIFKEKLAIFVADRRLLRSTFIRKIEIKEKIGLYGITKRNVSGFIMQARNHYNLLINEVDILSQVSKFIITAETIAEKLSGIDEVEEAHRKFMDADKAVEDATDVFEKEYGKLLDWIREFQDACRIVLKDRIQLLEKVGVVVRSAPLPRKKATDNPDSQDTQVPDETPENNPNTT
jgi:hypothetical protein